MQKQQLVAVDTNIALSLASGDETSADALQLIVRRITSVQIVASSTVIAELTFQARFAPESPRRGNARKALESFRKFGIKPVPLNSVQEAIAAKAADELRHSRLLPAAERNDALIIAESATLNCVLLVSNDSHLLDIDPKLLGLFFRERDLPAPIIVSPRELVGKFYR